MDSRTYLWLGYTVIAVVIFLTLFSAIARSSDKDSLEGYISAEIAWFQQVLFVSNYNFSLSYQVEEDYNILFEKPCLVNVGKTGTPVFAGRSMGCSPNLYDELIYPETVLSSSLIQFIKQRESLEVLPDE